MSEQIAEKLQIQIDKLEAAQNPFDLFEQWYDDAAKTEINDYNAMSVATVDADGFPDVRILLLKGFSAEGFVFYTNTKSNKGQQLASNPVAALCFHWKSLKRQVRIRGNITSVEEAAADSYFQSRPKGSRIGAWASSQSSPLESRSVLEDNIRKLETRYPGNQIPRPPHWSGYLLIPETIEFWLDRPFRLHDRIVFTRNTSGDENWIKTRLYP